MNDKPLKAIYIEWLDSTTSGGPWESKNRKGRDDVMNCTSLGFLVEETDMQITVANSHHPESGDVASPMTIPKCAITKRRWVKY